MGVEVEMTPPGSLSTILQYTRQKNRLIEMSNSTQMHITLAGPMYQTVEGGEHDKTASRRGNPGLNRGIKVPSLYSKRKRR